MFFQENVPLPPSSESPITSQSSDVLNSSQDEPVTDGLLASKTSTPRLTPPGSPPSVVSGSPKRTAKPVSPRRHSISSTTTRSMSDDRSSTFSSATSSPYWCEYWITT
ncbi:hypothetical protein Hdeb2414_s0018g00515271 [Helianthus debilis subsp. tardiflorus]